jgi:hypothetical protein
METSLPREKQNDFDENQPRSLTCLYITNSSSGRHVSFVTKADKTQVALILGYTAV